MASDNDMPISPLSTEGDERNFVLLLISLYRDNSNLWDSENPHYLNKTRRSRSLKHICDTLKVYRPDYTVEHLKKKINILRTNFNKERNKIELRKETELKNGVLERDPEPTLWYYYDLMFLTDKKKRPHKKPVMSIPPSQNREYKPLQKKIRLPESSVSSSNIQDNEVDLLTKCWAMKLRKLDPDQRVYAEKIINDTLFEAAMGTLTRHGVSFIAENQAFVACENEETQSPLCKISPLSE